MSQDIMNEVGLNLSSNQMEEKNELGISSEKIPRLHQLILSVVPENEDSEEIKKIATDVDRIPVYVVLDNDPHKVQGVINLNEEQLNEINVDGGTQEHFDPNGGAFIIENASKGAEVDIQTLQKTNSHLNLIDHVDNEVENESLDDSNFNEENLLAHLAKQVAFQQHYLSLSEYTADNIESEKPNQISGEVQHQNGLENHFSAGSCNQNVGSSNQTACSDTVTGGYSILPSLLNEPPVSTATWFPVTLTPTSMSAKSPQIISGNTTQHPGSIVTNISNIPNQQVITSTPTTSQRVLQPVQLDGSGRFVYTPHPKTGQFLYVSQISDTESPKIFKVNPTETPTPVRSGTTQINSTPNIRVDTNCRQLRLNSSGEENQSSPDFQTDQTSSPDDSSIDKNKLTFEFSLINGCEEGRETHNLKERKRRARIKDACDVMRKLVPGMSDKTDKATVFEFAARYIHYLKSFVGSKHDKDFLLKYSPY